MSPTHKIVLITGANQGIGYLTALQLSKLDGYHIFVGARSADKGAEAVKKIEAEGSKSAVEPILIDLDSDDSLFAAVKKIESKFGRLDVLVNNAAVSFEAMEPQSPRPPVRELMAATYAPNVFGTATLTEAALPLLEKSSFPSIVNLSTLVASLSEMSNKESPWYHAQSLAYSTSKAAVNGLTVYHAYVLAKTKPASRVVAISPGYCATNMNGYGGVLDPKVGAAGVVLAITQGPDSEWKTAEFRDYDGSLISW